MVAAQADLTSLAGDPELSADLFRRAAGLSDNESERRALLDRADRESRPAAVR